jgi:hypothetical protein
MATLLTPTYSVPVCVAAVKTVTKATPAVPSSIEKHEVGRGWIDATICGQSSRPPTYCVGRLTGTLETIGSSG